MTNIVFWKHLTNMIRLTLIEDLQIPGLNIVELKFLLPSYDCYYYLLITNGHRALTFNSMISEQLCFQLHLGLLNHTLVWLLFHGFVIGLLLLLYIFDLLTIILDWWYWLLHHQSKTSWERLFYSETNVSNVLGKFCSHWTNIACYSWKYIF